MEEMTTGSGRTAWVIRAAQERRDVAETYMTPDRVLVDVSNAHAA
jgi:hypothetical protein